MTARTATFAGYLHPDDYAVSVADGLVTISGSRSAGLPGDDGCARSPRPYVIITNSMGRDAGRSIDAICRDFTAQYAPARADQVPGESLEVWLLPVFSAMLDYLITPAGEWPPPEQS